jgi:cytochrome P450
VSSEQPNIVDWNPGAAFAAVTAGTEAELSPGYGAAISRGSVVRASMPRGGTAWVVVGAKALRQVLLDHRTFSSAVAHFGTTRLPPIEADPPEHSAYRRLLNPYFRPERLATMEPALRTFAADAVTQLIAGGAQGEDALETLVSVPVRSLCLLLGIADSDWPVVRRIETALHAAGGRLDAHDRSRSAERGELATDAFSLASDLMAARRSQPRDDLVSGIVNWELGGRRLTEEEALGIIILIILAGFGTTFRTLAAAVRLLASDQALQSTLREAPERIPAAVEEVLRIDSGAPALDRIATRDLELGGCPIRRGDAVMTAYGAANHDPADVEAPSEFRLDRGPNRHLAFGHGVHKCVGAPLARLEVRLFLEELLARTQSITLAGPVQRKPWPDLSCVTLPLTIT